MYTIHEADLITFGNDLLKKHGLAEQAVSHADLCNFSVKTGITIDDTERPVEKWALFSIPGSKSVTQVKIIKTHIDEIKMRVVGYDVQFFIKDKNGGNVSNRLYNVGIDFLQFPE